MKFSGFSLFSLISILRNPSTTAILRLWSIAPSLSTPKSTGDPTSNFSCTIIASTNALTPQIPISMMNLLISLGSFWLSNFAVSINSIIAFSYAASNFSISNNPRHLTLNISIFYKLGLFASFTSSLSKDVRLEWGSPLFLTDWMRAKRDISLYRVDSFSLV